jgi:hypothetical protein
VTIKCIFFHFNFGNLILFGLLDGSEPGVHTWRLLCSIHEVGPWVGLHSCDLDLVWTGSGTIYHCSAILRTRWFLCSGFGVWGQCGFHILSH